MLISFQFISFLHRGKLCKKMPLGIMDSCLNKLVVSSITPSLSNVKPIKILCQNSFLKIILSHSTLLSLHAVPGLLMVWLDTDA